MNILDTLITDRTIEDVYRYEDLNKMTHDEMSEDERAEWDAGMKGAYDYRDMNRVVGAMEYVDHLMKDAKRPSVYQPVIIPHKVPVSFNASGLNVTQWREWSDKVWIDYDLPTPALWAAHLQNIHRLWAAARRFEAIVIPKYDPRGNGYIDPGTVINAGDMFCVTDSVGLLELRITAVCQKEAVPDGGSAWKITQTGTGWEAVLDYPNGPYQDINEALAALKIVSSADAVIDGAFTLSALLRYDYLVTAGTCTVRWSPFITWGEAHDLYQTWGGTKGLTWDLAARGRLWPRVGQGWFTIKYEADFGKE